MESVQKTEQKNTENRRNHSDRPRKSKNEGQSAIQQSSVFNLEFPLRGNSLAKPNLSDDLHGVEIVQPETHYVGLVGRASHVQRNFAKQSPSDEIHRVDLVQQKSQSGRRDLQNKTRRSPRSRRNDASSIKDRHMRTLGKSTEEIKTDQESTPKPYNKSTKRDDLERKQNPHRLNLDGSFEPTGQHVAPHPNRGRSGPNKTSPQDNKNRPKSDPRMDVRSKVNRSGDRKNHVVHDTHKSRKTAQHCRTSTSGQHRQGLIPKNCSMPRTRSIGVDDVKGSGIVFVRKDDLLSRFAMTISRRQYSMIGFYYTTSASGTGRVNVLAIDLDRLETVKWNDPISLEDLANDPLTTKISIKSLKPIHTDAEELGRPSRIVDTKKTAQLHDYFRSTIAEQIHSSFNQRPYKKGDQNSSEPTKSPMLHKKDRSDQESPNSSGKRVEITDLEREIRIREWIRSIFEYRLYRDDYSSEITPVELVNNVIVEVAEKVDPGSIEMLLSKVRGDPTVLTSTGGLGHGSLSIEDRRSRSSEGALSPEAHSGLARDELRSSTMLPVKGRRSRQRLLPGVAVSTMLSPQSGLARDERSSSTMLIKTHLIDNDMFGDFLTLILTEKDAGTVELARRAAASKQRELAERAGCVFGEMMMEDQDFYDAVISKIDHSDIPIDPERRLNASIANIIGSGGNLAKCIIGGLHGEYIFRHRLDKLLERYSEDEQSLAVLTSTDVEPIEIPPTLHHDQAIQILGPSRVDGMGSYISALNRIRNHVQIAIDNIHLGETPVFDLNGMATAINDLIYMSGTDVESIRRLDGETSHKAVATISSGQSKRTPIQLRSGKKVVLTTAGFDLSPFDKDQLEEILCVLDVIADGDNRFDDLRAEVVHRLSDVDRSKP